MEAFYRLWMTHTSYVCKTSKNHLNLQLFHKNCLNYLGDLWCQVKTFQNMKDWTYHGNYRLQGKHVFCHLLKALSLQNMAFLNEIFCVQRQKYVCLIANIIMDKRLKNLVSYLTSHIGCWSPGLTALKSMQIGNYCSQESSLAKRG